MLPKNRCPCHQDLSSVYHLLECICARHQERFSAYHPENSAQSQSLSQHLFTGSFGCSFLMRTTVAGIITSLTDSVTLLCRPPAGVRHGAASSDLLASGACQDVVSVAPGVTMQELKAEIALAEQKLGLLHAVYTRTVV